MSSHANRSRLTQLFASGQASDEANADELYELVYAELHAMAVALMRRQRPEHTLQATALVNEAYMKLAHGGSFRMEQGAEFFGLASKAMRSILIDYARRNASQKRGGHLIKEPLHETRIGVDSTDLDLLDFDEALLRLEVLDPRAARIVELRCFGGLENEEIAKDLELSTRSIERHWAFARAWLIREVG